MKKKIFIIVALAMFIAMPLGSVYAYEAMIGHTGVLQYDKDATLDGYVLFSPAGEKGAYLIDEEGYVMNEWQCSSGPGLHDRLLPNGHLLRGYTPAGWSRTGAGGTKPFPVTIGGVAGGVEEFDWDGNLVWQHPAISDTYIQHHSFYRMNNGNTLILLWEEVTMEDCIALGRDPDLVTEQYGLWPDAVIEVTPAGDTVWEWHAFDHLVQNRDPALPNYGEPVDNPNKLDMNFFVPTRFGKHDWSHCNTIEYNEVTDQIIVNFRNWGEFYVYDHSTPNSEGSILFRWGNPGAYGAGDLPEWPEDGDQQLWGPHCAVWLGTGDHVNYGTPGNIMVLDNGWLRPSGTYTRPVEVKVNYDNWNEPAVWTWAPADRTGFYSTFQCGNGRLSNGNTFVTSTDGGHFIEIQTTWADDGKYTNKVVWEYVVPGPGSTDDTRACYTNDRVRSSVHRAHKYGADYPAFTGKDLSRKREFSPNCTVIWDKWNEHLGYVPVPPTTYTGWGADALAGEGGGGDAGGGGGGGGGGGY